MATKQKQAEAQPPAAEQDQDLQPQGDQDQTPDQAPPPEPPAPAPPAATEPAISVDDVVPEATGLKSSQALNLLLDACERFGVDPRHTTRPAELASWKFYPANRVERTPAAVVIVTHGGQKLRHNADGTTDDDTLERLRHVLGLWYTDKATKELKARDLPQDQVLPEAAVTGIVGSVTHRHVGGYLRRK